MYRLSCLLVAGLITGVSLIAMTSPAAAEANCPAGATCNCVPTTFTKCKADAQGNQYDCQTFKGEKCTVVSGPGSGKAAAAAQPGNGAVLEPGDGPVTPPIQGTAALPDKGAVVLPDKGAVAPPGKSRVVSPKQVAPRTAE